MSATNHVSCPTCPTCARVFTTDDSDPVSAKVAPFCSNRCKDIDFGKWLSEDYSIPPAAEPED